MYQTALLLLSGPFRIVIESIGQFLKWTDKKVAKRLYVKLEPDLSKPFTKYDSLNLKQLSLAVPVVYDKASKNSSCKNVDVRLLIGNFKLFKPENSPKLNCEAVFTNYENISDVNHYFMQNFDFSCNTIISIDDISKLKQNVQDDETDEDYVQYKTVILGGTFDRLHNGHKVLLSEAVLKATDKLIIGVSTGPSLKKKVLWELIEPVEKRIEDVSNFLKDIDPSLHYEFAPIIDIYGPTITVPDIDCLVATTETKVGGIKVNEERKNRGMKEVIIHVVNLVENAEHSVDEDEKLSSSTNRMHLLGMPLKQQKPTFYPGKPYCILFQGHPVCGKTAICSKFQALGIPVLSCDDILEAILDKDEHFKEDFTKQFPDDTSLCGETTLNFGKLMTSCLISKEKRDWLMQSNFQKMKSALNQVLHVYKQQGVHVIIVTDSTPFENCDLDIDVDEIWASIFPTVEV